MVSLKVSPLKVVLSMCLKVVSLCCVCFALLMDVFGRKTKCLGHNPLLTLTVPLLI